MVKRKEEAAQEGAVSDPHKTKPNKLSTVRKHVATRSQPTLAVHFFSRTSLPEPAEPVSTERVAAHVHSLSCFARRRHQQCFGHSVPHHRLQHGLLPASILHPFATLITPINNLDYNTTPVRIRGTNSTVGFAVFSYVFVPVRIQVHSNPSLIIYLLCEITEYPLRLFCLSYI